MYSVWFRRTIVRLLKFLQIKEGDLIPGGNQFCKMSELFGPPFSISVLNVLWTQIICHSLDFNGFSVIEEYHCSDILNFYKLKRGALSSGWNQFGRKSELLGPPFCISILKHLWTEITRHSLDFNGFYLIQKNFCQPFKISTN